MSFPIALRFVGGFLLALLMIASARAADLGTKVAFQANTPIQFATFAITYIGERHVSSYKYPRGFDYHDFRVTSGKTVQTISWSAGTGDIGPVLFEVQGERYALELKRADKLGRLKDNELVVSRAP